MTGGQKTAAAIAGVGAAGIGGWVLYRTQNGQSILPKSVGGSGSSSGSGTGSQPGLLQTGSIYGGLKVTLPTGWPSTDGTLGTQVGGPSPGARGEHLFPALWAVAPKTVPGFVTCQKGTGWVTIAVDLQVSGDYNGQPASSQGPWVGTAEYTNGQLVRVFPGPANGGPSNMAALWSYAGFYC